MKRDVQGDEGVGRKLAARVTAPIPNSLAGRAEQVGNRHVPAQRVNDCICRGQNGRALSHAPYVVHETWTGQVHETLMAEKKASSHHARMFRDDLPPESKENIAVRLRLTREALGFSLTEFAKTGDMSKSRYENYESGINLMKPEVAARFIKAHPQAKIDFNWLYHGDLNGVAHDFASKVKALMDGKAVA